MAIITECLRYLDNTFIGSILAGLVLTVVGLAIYREQKKIDIKTGDYLKLKKHAAFLHSHLQKALARYDALVNTFHASEYVKLMPEEVLNTRRNKIGTELAEIAQKGISRHFDDFSAALKIRNDFGVNIKLLHDRIFSIVSFPRTTSVVSIHSDDDAARLRSYFKKMVGEVETELRKILDRA